MSCYAGSAAVAKEAVVNDANVYFKFHVCCLNLMFQQISFGESSVNSVLEFFLLCILPCYNQLAQLVFVIVLFAIKLTVLILE